MKNKWQKCSTPENIPIYVNFFWHLPSITFVNGFLCEYMCVNEGRRPKIKQNKTKKTEANIHTRNHFKQKEKKV